LILYIEIKISDIKERFYEFCRYRQWTANLSHTSKIRIKAKLNRIYINLINGDATLLSIIKIINIFNSNIVFEEEFDYELIDVTNIKGVRYFILIINNYSKYR
jgi:hypothetical protein